jgi:hypothetical protein
MDLQERQVSLFGDVVLATRDVACEVRLPGAAAAVAMAPDSRARSRFLSPEKLLT